MKLITYLKQAASEGILRGTGVEEHGLLVPLWKCRQGHPTGSTRLHGAAGEGEEYYCREGASHVVIISHPSIAADLIEQAAATAAK